MKYVNEAGWDRIVRIGLGIVLLYLGWAGIVAGGWGTFLKIIGFLPLLTGLVGFCPLYAVLKIRTDKTAA
ncbi:MAG: DUF2892 domain-containing protein [Anaerolineales bacterium]|nr:DUF2892 domain-containing protein [Anaerolineales bacterium]